jgi:voltage-gated potassium channel
MLLLFKLFIGAIMIGLTVIIHAIVCDRVLRFIQTHTPPFSKILKKYWKIPALITAVFIIGAAIMVDIWLWTILFYSLDRPVLKDIETALYFTTACFTTVGFGDVVLGTDWRILSTITGINGMIIFGWSTAFIFEIMTKLYEGGRYHMR